MPSPDETPRQAARGRSSCQEKSVARQWPQQLLPLQRSAIAAGSEPTAAAPAACLGRSGARLAPTGARGPVGSGTCPVSGSPGPKAALRSSLIRLSDPCTPQRACPQPACRRFPLRPAALCFQMRRQHPHPQLRLPVAPLLPGAGRCLASQAAPVLLTELAAHSHSGPPPLWQPAGQPRLGAVCSSTPARSGWLPRCWTYPCSGSRSSNPA
mmetsp:Transcript_72824/g.170858  ORF Transcript_72824/g.170858 Transcript_72824/m.170858 type:complete len:211 (-) Transcript_72824:1683-2315(-)